MKKLAYSALLFFLIFANDAHARVFSFGESWFTAYFRGTGGISQMGDSAYSNTSGDETVFKGDEPSFNTSAEIGFVLNLGEALSARIGVEGIQAGSVSTSGNSELFTSQKHMDIESRVSALNPNINFEFTYQTNGTSRFYGFLGAGYSQVKVKNEYTLTALGQTDYAGAASYSDVWEADVLSYQLGAGYEVHAFDNVSFNFEAGYRYMDVTGLEYADTHDMIKGGVEQTLTKGSKVTDANGKEVSLDMGGVFVGIMFRFYLPPMR